MQHDGWPPAQWCPAETAAMTGGSGVPGRAGIGICLSAGGFRAALFGLGAIRYLAEAGLLPQVTAISAISGGSIIGAWLAQRWPLLTPAGSDGGGFVPLAAEPFCELLASRNLRNRWLARWLSGRLRPGGITRGRAFADALAAGVLSDGALSGLPADVQLVLTSTDLISGQPFHFAQDFVGSAAHGYSAPPATLRLATAVAASAADPTAFSPVQISTAALGLDREPAWLSLVDGAVYENLGTEWFEDWDVFPRPRAARRPGFLVVVDGAGPLKPERRRPGSLRSFLRAADVATAHMRSERIHQTRQQFARQQPPGVLLSIREGPGPGAGVPFPLSDPVLYGGLARIRTDLDRFLPVECGLLQFAGYWTLHSRLRDTHPGLAMEQPGWHRAPGPDDPSALARILAHSARHWGAGRYF